jgi:putative cell wall-binding protein
MRRITLVALTVAMVAALTAPASGQQQVDGTPIPQVNLDLFDALADPPVPLAAKAAASRAYASPDEPWLVHGSCSGVFAAPMDVLSTDRPVNGSPYGWDVTLTPAGGGQPTVMQSAGFAAIFNARLPEGTYEFDAAPREGYDGESHRQTVTVADDGCPSAPAVTLERASRTLVRITIAGADERAPLGYSTELVGADGRTFPTPIELGSVFREDGIEQVHFTVTLPARVEHTLEFRALNQHGESTATSLRIPADRSGDERLSQRVSGRDRFATAAAIARESVPVTDYPVVVASGEDFPDALAAANIGAPLVLTGRDHLPEATAEFLASARAFGVLVVGGSAAVSDAVYEQIQQIVGRARVQRLAGRNRWETAAELLPGPHESIDTVVLASGQNFPDALSAGALASGAGVPLLLTARDTLPEPTREALTDLAPDRVLIAGGGAAVGDAVLDLVRRALPDAEVIRLSGGDRTATAGAIAEHGYAEGLFAGGRAILARGDSFADALAASALAGFYGVPILLTASPTVLGPGAADLFAERGCTVEDLFVAGGTAAVADAVVAQVTGPCDPVPSDRRQMLRAAASIPGSLEYLAELDQGKRPVGSLDYLIGPDATRSGNAYTTFDAGLEPSVARNMFYPLTLLVDDDAVGDGVVDDVQLLLDSDGDGTCSAGEIVVDVPVDGSEDPQARVC